LDFALQGVTPKDGGMNPQRKLKIFGGESFNFSFFLIPVWSAERTKTVIYIYTNERGDVLRLMAKVWCGERREFFFGSGQL